MEYQRKRYPQYDHCAILVAEDITSRFLNVIGLFNGTIPLIALQMQALKVGNHTTLIFTKVMDELKRGPDIQTTSTSNSSRVLGNEKRIKDNGSTFRRVAWDCA